MTAKRPSATAIAGAWRKLPLPPSKVMSSGAQMLGGGVFLALTAAALGEFRNFHPWTISRGAWLSLLYLIVTGSLVSLLSAIHIEGLHEQFIELKGRGGRRIA
jgi:hypothetical protein